MFSGCCYILYRQHRHRGPRKDFMPTRKNIKIYMAKHVLAFIGGGRNLPADEKEKLVLLYQGKRLHKVRIMTFGSKAINSEQLVPRRENAAALGLAQHVVPSRHSGVLTSDAASSNE